MQDEIFNPDRRTLVISSMEAMPQGKTSRQTVKICFEGYEQPLYRSAEVAANYHLGKGMSVPAAAADEMIFENEKSKAMQRALYLLDGRDYSYVEMYTKLSASYADEICAFVMDKLTSGGQINDSRYASALAESLCLKKGYGEYRARLELKRRGIPDEVIDDALSEYRDDTSERAAAVIRRKYRSCLGDEKGMRRLKAALARLGYSYSDIKNAIRAVLDEMPQEFSDADEYDDYEY